MRLFFGFAAALLLFCGAVRASDDFSEFEHDEVFQYVFVFENFLTFIIE